MDWAEWRSEREKEGEAIWRRFPPKFSRQQRPHTLIQLISCVGTETDPSEDVIPSHHDHQSYHHKACALFYFPPKGKACLASYLLPSLPLRTAEFGVQCCFDRRHFLGSLPSHSLADQLFRRRRNGDRKLPPTSTAPFVFFLWRCRWHPNEHGIHRRHWADPTTYLPSKYFIMDAKLAVDSRQTVTVSKVRQRTRARQSWLKSAASAAVAAMQGSERHAPRKLV